MLTHSDVWRAIDRLATEYGMSPSGLARRAGLDPTTFNKSKRITREGKQRWPSTESVAKILATTGATLSEFVSLMSEGNATVLAQRPPLLGVDQAGQRGSFDSKGRPAGNAWDEVLYPHIGDPHAYALEITKDGLLPAYRNGDILIVSPVADYRRGDRIVLKPRQGKLMIRELVRESARRFELKRLDGSGETETVAAEEVQWVARIIWVSQ